MDADRLHQIKEGDLIDLERILPQLVDAMMPVMTNRIRCQFRLCQKILSQVRWNYGPPEQIGAIPADE